MYSLILTKSNDCLFPMHSNFHKRDEFSSVGFISLSHWFLRISLCYRTRLAWLNSGSFLMLTNIGQKYIFFFYLETTSTQISFTCNVSVSILRKIIGPWKHFWLIERQKVWTDIVITKEHPQKLGGALIPVLKHTVLFDTRDIIFNIHDALLIIL